MPNYAKEARIRDVLADEGVLDSEHETFLIEHREGHFSDDPADIRRHVAERRETRPHRFEGKDERELCRRAFVDGILGAQGEIVKRYGLVEANRIADQYGTHIGSTKRGADPYPDSDKDHANNPWANRAENVDPKTARYSSLALKRQHDIARTNPAMASRIAAAVGSKIGDVRPTRVA